MQKGKAPLLSSQVCEQRRETKIRCYDQNIDVIIIIISDDGYTYLTAKRWSTAMLCHKLYLDKFQPNKDSPSDALDLSKMFF